MPEMNDRKKILREILRNVFVFKLKQMSDANRYANANTQENEASRTKSLFTLRR